MLISKKDLLIETGISYGQLYRWKREKLIPEDWFLKQPSYTGQETFFPRQKILNRVEVIQEMKAKYCLEDLAKILSPEVVERTFTTDDLEIISEISKGLIPTFINVFDKEIFSYTEVLMMIAISEFKKESDASLRKISDLVLGIKEYCNKIKMTNYILVLFDKSNDFYATLYQENTEVFIDSRINIIKKIRLDDISNNIKLKYEKYFNFIADNKTIEEPK